jgi:glycosyltransferase involved in cell wall biosynthesis
MIAVQPLPLVTIGIPTYRRLEYLKEAVVSALAQTYRPIEILISQDPTPNGPDEALHTWCQQLLHEKPEVRYQLNDHNLGLAGNWNAITDAASGEYLMIIGDDDRLRPDCIATLVQLAHPDGAVAFSNHYIIDSLGKVLEEESKRTTSSYSRDALAEGEVNDPEHYAWLNGIPMSASLVRTDIVRRLRFKEELNTPELELFVRMASESLHFRFTPAYLAEYRVHAQAATAAGLRTEKLVLRLLDYPVQPANAPAKHALLSPMLINAVGRCLLDGDVLTARRMIHSPYYPTSAGLRGLVQKLCIDVLPPLAGTLAYRIIHRLPRPQAF